MEKLIALFEGFDIEKLGASLPEAGTLFNGLSGWLVFFVLVGPLLMLGFGIYYWFFAPKEANHSMGFRFGYAMSCVEVWQFTQKLAGITYAALGLLLTLIMGLISFRFGKLTPPDMVWLAAKCLIWEIVLMLIFTLVVDIVIIVLFDIKGNPRLPQSKELLKQKPSKTSGKRQQSTPARRVRRTNTESTRKANTESTRKANTGKTRAPAKKAGGKFQKGKASQSRPRSTAGKTGSNKK